MAGVLRQWRRLFSFTLTVHSGTFQAAFLCAAPHTPGGSRSAAACPGASAAPGGAWTPARGRGWRNLRWGSPPAHPRGPLCRSDPPAAAGSSCTCPKAAGRRDAGGDSLWGGADTARPFSPSEPGDESSKKGHKSIPSHGRRLDIRTGQSLLKLSPSP